MPDATQNILPTQNIPEMSVSEVSAGVKKLIEGAYTHIRVRGEIGRVSYPASGHVYLDLKDTRAVLAGVIWKGLAKGLKVKPEEGLEVIASGYMTSFAGQSKYQMVIENIALAGIGELMALMEKRKEELTKEGLFDPARKQKIPFLPNHIGIITSPSGAAIRDILHRLRGRFWRPLTLWPVTVQGPNSAKEVADAIAGFNRFARESKSFPRPDLIIVARGGGALEDLWGFNEEIVVRATAESTIPIISAIGHETDTTLIDFAADLRAPTPSAAAELCVPVRLELINKLGAFGQRMCHGFSARHQNRRQRLDGFARRLTHPTRLIANAAQHLDLLAPRLPSALTATAQHHRISFEHYSACLRPQFLKAEFVKNSDKATHLSQRLSGQVAQKIERYRTRLSELSRLYTTLGYRSTLKRGYTITRTAKGAILTRAQAAKSEENFDIEFFDGRVKAGAARLGDANPKGTKNRKATKIKGTSDKNTQGELF